MTEFMHVEEENILHNQLRLLANRSENCEFSDLAAISEQMVAIYSILNNQNQ